VEPETFKDRHLRQNTRHILGGPCRLGISTQSGGRSRLYPEKEKEEILPLHKYIMFTAKKRIAFTNIFPSCSRRFAKIKKNKNIQKAKKINGCMKKRSFFA
jgi:hypothetical protein